MNKIQKTIFSIFAIFIFCLVVNTASAALSHGQWTENEGITLTINNGQSAEFEYTVQAVTTRNGRYSVNLYRDNTLIHTYINNQATVNNGAGGDITVNPADYNNAVGNYKVVIYATDDFGSYSFTLTLTVVPPGGNLIHDLEVYGVIFPTSPQNEGTYSWFASATNTGDYTENSVLRFYINGVEQANCAVSISNLVAGATSNMYSCTRDFAAGIYTLSIHVDQVVGETDLADNTASFNFVVNSVINPLIVEINATPISGIAPLTVQFNSTVSGGVQPYYYSWDFDDSSTSAVSNPIHTFNLPGTYTVVLTVTDSAGNTATDSIVITVTGTLDISQLECFPNVIIGSMQACTVRVTINNTNIPVADASVRLYDLSNDEFYGNCITDTISGSCLVLYPVNVLGTFTVYATAERPGYISDLDKTPTYTYNVLDNEYTISELKVYNDNLFTTEDYDFYRNETMYVRFQILDSNNNSVNNLVNSVTLVSLPGGRENLSVYPTAEPNWERYYGIIPRTHDFLGDSQVFAISIDTANNTGAQQVVSLIIRNNPPRIINLPNTINLDNTIQLDLSQYEFDVEDAGENLTWSVSGVNTNVAIAAVNGKILTLTPVSIGTETITLTLTDLDGTIATQDMDLIITNTTNSTIPTITVDLTPDIAYDNDDLHCDARIYDIDSNTLSATYNIYSAIGNGAGLFETGVVNCTLSAGNYYVCPQITIPNAVTLPGQTWTCTMQPFDGQNYGLSASDSVTILNGTSNYAHNLAVDGTFPVGIQNPGPITWSAIVSNTGDFAENSTLRFFVDGNEICNNNIYLTAGESTPELSCTHNFGAGTYDLEVRVDSVPGETYLADNINSQTIGVGQSNGGLTVTINANPKTGEAPLKVNFDSTVTGGSGIYTYKWEFGDAITSASADPIHTYKNNGNYVARLYVTDSLGNSGMASVLITVEDESNGYELAIKSIDLYGEYGEIIAGDDLMAAVSLKNYGSKLEDVKISVTIMDLGLRKTIGPFDMPSGAVVSKTLIIELPEDAQGEYDVEITASNDIVRKTTYRTIVINQ